MQGISANTLNIDELQTRLKDMSDEELWTFGKAARSMCSPEANLGKPPLEVFGIQLELEGWILGEAVTQS